MLSVKSTSAQLPRSAVVLRSSARVVGVGSAVPLSLCCKVLTPLRCRFCCPGCWFLLICYLSRRCKCCCCCSCCAGPHLVAAWQRLEGALVQQVPPAVRRISTSSDIPARERSKDTWHKAVTRGRFSRVQPFTAMVVAVVVSHPFHLSKASLPGGGIIRQANHHPDLYTSCQPCLPQWQPAAD